MHVWLSLSILWLERADLDWTNALFWEPPQKQLQPFHCIVANKDHQVARISRSTTLKPVFRKSIHEWETCWLGGPNALRSNSNAAFFSFSQYLSSKKESQHSKRWVGRGLANLQNRFSSIVAVHAVNLLIGVVRQSLVRQNGLQIHNSSYKQALTISYQFYSLNYSS